MSLKPLTHSLFTEHFGYAPALTIQAPGRVNLIGEHTDYNDGFVLPCAIDYQTVIACAKRDDRQIRVLAADYQNQLDQFSLDDPIVSHPDQRWSDYVRGVVKHLQRRNADFGGADLVIAGNVPQGAGLSSSAALEVAVGRAAGALSAAAGRRSAGAEWPGGGEPIRRLQLRHHGPADLRARPARQRSADRLPLLETRAVSMPDNVAVVIVNSNVQRGLVDSEYNTRRKQCEEAARFFGVKALRDVSPEQFEARQHQLDPLVAKRARHVISENARTLAAAEALAAGDLQRMGRLMAESHASMRDDFEITVPPIDKLVEIVKATIGPRGGVRMTGGGFGGCIVALMPQDLVETVRAAVAHEYPRQTDGLRETFYVCQASQGAGLC